MNESQAMKIESFNISVHFPWMIRWYNQMESSKWLRKIGGCFCVWEGCGIFKCLSPTEDTYMNIKFRKQAWIEDVDLGIIKVICDSCAKLGNRLDNPRKNRIKECERELWETLTFKWQLKQEPTNEQYTEYIV